MNKNDIKQIILEEIKAVINEMASPEELAADSRPEDEDFSLEDEMEMARDFNDEQDDIFGKPNFVEEEGLEEMARTSNIFKLSQEASLQDVLQFMQRVNDVLKTYKSPGQKRPKKRFTPEEMKALATAMLNPEGFTSKDVIAVTSYNSPAQANKFLKALEMKGLITLTSQLKKSMEPTRDPDAPETRGRKRRDAEFDMSDDPMTDLDALGLGGDIDLSDPLAENNNTMSELEKYIKKQIKEAKNPLATKMKEIETQGRVAALETKLAAVAEMIEETEGRLTRIDEDNEFRDMMDKNAVKEVRKQLKELERAKAKLQKEYDKVSGGRKKEKVVDELDAEETRAKADNLDALADRQDALDQEAGEVEEVSFELNESTLRFQKLAGLITESDIKKKLSLNETSVYARKNKTGMMTGKEIIKHYQNDIINPGADFILKNMRIMQKVAKGEPFKYKIFPGNTAYYAYFKDNFLKRKLPKHVQDNSRIYKTLRAYFDKVISKQIKAGEELASREDKNKLT